MASVKEDPIPRLILYEMDILSAKLKELEALKAGIESKNKSPKGKKEYEHILNKIQRIYESSKSLDEFITFYGKYKANKMSSAIYGDQYLINSIDDYSSIKIIGKGAQGVVKLLSGKSKYLAYPVPDRVILKEEKIKYTGFSEAMNEIDIGLYLASAIPKHVSRLLAAEVKIGQYGITASLVFEYIHGYDMYNYYTELNKAIAHERKTHPEKSDELNDLFIETCETLYCGALEAIKALHKLGIVHRDIKPENLYVETEEGSLEIKSVRLIDFGFAERITPDKRSVAKGTPMYYKYNLYWKNNMRVFTGVISPDDDIYALDVMWNEMTGIADPPECDMVSDNKNNTSTSSHIGGYKPTQRNMTYLSKWRKGKSIGFTMRSSLKAKGLIPRSNGTYKVSAKYRRRRRR